MAAIAPSVGPGRPSPADGDEDPPTEILRVSTSSDVKGLAGAIAGCVRSSGAVALEVVGAGALNQAVKASAVARSMLQAEGLDLVATPTFRRIEIDGEPRNALRLHLDHRFSPPA
ncbi:MAG TPA: stage V sporulation protein S [Iamia sp.]